MDSRFASGSNIYDLAVNGWCIKSDFTPPTANLMPIVATGIPSADYAGGELVDEFVGDIQFSVPLIYKGTAPQSARRALEAFIRTGVKAKTLQFQIRQERAFDIVPLWGQWGAWQTFEVIHAGVVAGDDRSWIGDVNGWHYAELVLTCKPAILGQAQLAAQALGDIELVKGADGLDQGVRIKAESIAVSSVTGIYSAAATVDGDNGTIMIVWESDGDPPLVRTEYNFLSVVDGINFYFDPGDELWTITDDTNTYDSADGKTFPADGATLVFHITYATGGSITLYINGVATATGAFAAFTPLQMNFGTSDAGENGCYGIFRMVSTYASAMTATQVAADYADIVKALAAGGSPSPIPYLWTPEGLSVFDNCRDDATSTGAPHYNYGWLAGVPGTMPAAMDMRLTPSELGSNIKRIAVSMVDYDDQFDPLTTDLLYNDRVGTGDADSSSGAYLSTTIDTTPTVQISTVQTAAVYKSLAGRQAAIYARIQSGSTGAFQIKLVISSGGSIIGEAKNIATSTGFRLLRTPFMTLPVIQAPEIAEGRGASIQLYANRTTGSGAALFDYGMVMARPLVEIDVSAFGSGVVSIYEGFVNTYKIPDVSWSSAPARGDVLRPLPHRQNLIMVSIGNENIDPLISLSVTASINIIPRWSIL